MNNSGMSLCPAASSIRTNSASPPPPKVKPVSAKSGYERTGRRPPGRPSNTSGDEQRVQEPSSRLDRIDRRFLLTSMKHSQLHTIAHNFTDSLARGLGFVVGYYATDVFADAACNPNGSLVVDFLTGQLDEGTASDQLLHALPVFRNEFENFCQKHGATKSDFTEFKTKFQAGRLENMYTVTITDTRGRRSSIDYKGFSGRRIKILDDKGRIVPNKTVLDT